MDDVTYVIAGGKGGIGRTTTTLQLGMALEKTGYNTAIVDADLEMADMEKLIDVDPAATVHDVIDRSASTNEAVVDGPAGVTIMPGNSSLGAFSSTDEKWPKLKRAVEPLQAAHDIVLLDTPPGLRRIHRDVLTAADGTILVTTPDSVAIDAAEQAAKVARHLESDVLGVVVTKAADSTNVQRIVTQLDQPALAIVPASAALVATPTSTDGPAVNAYERLGSIVATHRETGEVETAAVSLFVAEAEAGESAEQASTAEDSGSETSSETTTSSTGTTSAAIGTTSASTADETDHTQSDADDDSGVLGSLKEGFSGGSDDDDVPNPLDELQGDE